MVPDSFSGGTPCSSAAATNSARIGSTAPFMVIDTLIWSSGMPAEQRAHVVDRIDRHAGHADVAGHARMIGVVAAVGGEIERDRKAFLAGGEVAAIERVGIFRRGEPGILPDGPGLVDIHRRVGAAQIGRDAGPGLEEVDAFEIGLAVAGLDRGCPRASATARRCRRAARARWIQRRYPRSSVCGSWVTHYSTGRSEIATPQSWSGCWWLTMRPSFSAPAASSVLLPGRSPILPTQAKWASVPVA